MRARSDEERRLWRLTLALVGAVYLSAYFVQFVFSFLFRRNLLRLTLGAVVALVAVVAVVWLVRSGARWRAWATTALVGAAYAAAAFAIEVVQERVHLLEYGVLALVLRAALVARAAADREFGFRGGLATASGAFALAFLIGVGDEAIQGILPNRQGDLRDLGLNAASAAMALGAALAIEPALAADRRRPEDGR